MKAGQILLYGLICLLWIFGTAGWLSANPEVPLYGYSMPSQTFLVVDSFPAASDGIFATDTDGMSSRLKNWASFYGDGNLLHPEEFTIRPLEPAKTATWVFWLLILSLGGLSYARMYFPYRSRQYFRALLGIRNFNQMEREGGYFDEPPAWVFFVNFALIFSLLVVQTITQTDIISVFGDTPQHVLFGIISLLVFSFFLVKYLATGFIAWVFQTQSANATYTRNFYLFNNLAGVLILPVVIFNAFNPTPIALYIGWLIVLTLNVFKVYRGIVLGINRSEFSAYYLFLYFCTIELIPILLIAEIAGLNLL